MSFCGTIEHNRRWKMLGFGMHCSGLASQLLDLKYKRTLDEKRAGTKDEQMRLFNVTTEQRADFTKFAKNLHWFLKETQEAHTKDRESYWRECRDHEYTDYEFYQFFESYPDEKMKPVIALLERVGNGEGLTEGETKTAMDFLFELSGHAHAMTDRGGCF